VESLGSYLCSFLHLFKVLDLLNYFLNVLEIVNTWIHRCRLKGVVFIKTSWLEEIYGLSVGPFDLRI
jgi:hypothetical protein